jgi:hypothetical protein
VNWNVAGLDYPVGVAPGPGRPIADGAVVIARPYCNGRFVALGNPTKPCSTDIHGHLTPLIDPSRYDWAKDGSAGFAGVGCAPGANYGQNKPYEVFCVAGVAAMNVQGFDWTPAESSDGGQTYHSTCVGLRVNDAGAITSGSVDFTDNRIDWSGDLSCQTLATSILGPILLGVNITHAWTVHVWRNYIEQNAQAAYNTSGAPMWIGIGAPIFVGGAEGGVSRVAISVKYNYFGNLESRGVTFSMACGGFEFSYNVTNNIGDHSGGAHGEIFYAGPQHGIVDGRVVQFVHCPNFQQASELPITSWAGSTWGEMPFVKLINNAAWTDTSVRGNTNSFYVGNFDWAAPDLLNIHSGHYSLNTMVANYAADGGGRYVFMGHSQGLPPVSAKETSGYQPAPQDILAVGAAQCAVGATPYSFPPTLVVRQIGGSFRAGVADAGNCGYGQGGRGDYALTCLRCANHPSGFSTGWTVSAYFIKAGVSVLFTISGGNANRDGGLNGGFENYENLSIERNLFDVTGTLGVSLQDYPTEFGRYLSCSGGKPPPLPSGTMAPFFALGAGNARIVGNVTPSGAPSRNAAPFAPQNGC